jgi:hypothetical protein
MQDNQEPNTELTAHVNDEGRPLCNQEGDYLYLCEPDEFIKLPKECRCQRCERFLNHKTNINPLSANQQKLLAEISRRTPDQDSWCPLADLCKKKTEAALTSLNRLLRVLEVQDLVEIKADNHNKTFVRLKDKGYSEDGKLYDVFQISE